MEPIIAEVAERVRAMREMCDISVEEMAADDAKVEAMVAEAVAEVEAAVDEVVAEFDDDAGRRDSCGDGDVCHGDAP